MSDLRIIRSALLALLAAATLLGQPAAEPTSPDAAAPTDTAAADAKPKGPKWDVTALPGPAKDVVIDTDEGTWMNVDVSPDGREIVFDLLGDLYTMPITGGDATAISSGPAWDMQPRYSPDGRHIAFTSDRAGGDNIWVMNRDGSEPRQITNESFRLLNSPVWTPDGDYIAARKHFTSRRSLGAGEIWLYHRSGIETGGGGGGGGGDAGLQMTTRPTEQKDVGEPAFSPDGRYLYYSLDATPGSTFEYSKDSNDQIYAIDRLDRITGETERYISGPGGAIRPTPSPDGTQLAFARRVRFQTVLFLQDIRSGEIRPVYDALDRDMQETWAVHGVYPTIAWTPDSESLIFWAGGKIRRLDAASGQHSVIPFQVKAVHRVSDALRFPVEVMPRPSLGGTSAPEFDVRMLRWVEVSPTGDSVIYQALGHLYIRPLPDGRPRRLTIQNDHFEFFPSFSRDGQSIVYATWDDEKLGSIRVVTAAGGEGRPVTTRPGHYVDPAFSPDGSTIVFGKVSGGGLTSPTWSADPGVYRVAASHGGGEGGEPVRISTKGTNPQFGADSDRVYLTHVEPGKEHDKRMLISIDLNSSVEKGSAQERTHFVSQNATEYRLSPDGRWVAFRERFNAYIAPFVPTGREVEIGPKAAGLPVARVTRDSGQWLHWSGDSTRLHWSLGPELFTRPLTDCFAFLDGAPEKLPEAPESGVNIAFKAPFDVASGATALTGARIVTMQGGGVGGADEVIENGAIIVQNGRIVAVGPAADVDVPAGADVIDASGTTIIPGLIDVHAHGPQAQNGLTPEQNWSHYANLAFGVTTIHDPSHDTDSIFASAELAKAGLITSPRTFSTGTILYGAAGTAKAEIDTLDDARSHLRRLKAVGAFSVKSYNQPRRDQRQQVIAAARELGMMVVPEGGSLLQHNLTMILDGHTGIEHSLPVEKIYSDVAALWGASATGYTPTLVVAFGGIAGENYWYQHTNVWEHERLLTFVPRTVVDPRARRRTMSPDEDYNHLRSAAICKRLIDAGGRTQLGAHGQLAGLGAHWELWMLAQGGMTPFECLRAATIDGARYIGLDRDLGSLEPGKLADLVVLEQNPLDNIRHSETIRYTMLGGRLYDARTMAQLGHHPAPAPEFYWADGADGSAYHAWHTHCAGCTLPGGSDDEHPSGYR